MAPAGSGGRVTCGMFPVAVTVKVLEAGLGDDSAPGPKVKVYWTK